MLLHDGSLEVPNSLELSFDMVLSFSQRPNFTHGRGHRAITTPYTGLRQLGALANHLGLRLMGFLGVSVSLTAMVSIFSPSIAFSPSFFSCFSLALSSGHRNRHT